MLTGTTTPGDEPGRSAAPVAAETAALVDEARELPVFAEQFVCSPRGAHLARHLAVRRMEVWGYPPASDVSCAVALVVGELTANAVQHGRVPGRDFGLRLALDVAARASFASRSRTPPRSSRPRPRRRRTRRASRVEDFSWWTSWPCAGGRRLAGP
ncbi:hypothetical protein QFZ76_005500 [Streptomyces sp. V4I2]|nr:hypothetical protein [Streptomyces sp. V4I2]